MEYQEYLRQRNDGYRAIGRYIVAFSQLMHHLRNVIAWRVARTGENDLVEMTLGEANAKTITDSFFGMCRQLADFDEDEKIVETTLRNAATKASRMRNDIAHGDWWVGQLASYDSPQVENPVLVRIKPGRVGEHPEQEVDLSVNDLDKMADDLDSLTNTLVEFGRLALGLAILRRIDAAPGEFELSVGELRVKDVFAYEGPKKSATVVRTGPKADVVPQTQWVGKRHVLPDEELARRLPG